ncbi:hypothetical protein I2I05_08525 [Hymenobacter sp. BT683]|uniref:Uncharacterized protein n=1 Tax=Hymenobacter jeongseonensis TaxID=2791027 RepID=A0ABS0IGF5_9BACT|nr:hypothetical protein [Hymenobacter jeongseonensis]MBF9237441.1 hypothetical protein [Hymenobacter jeongseonensis]
MTKYLINDTYLTEFTSVSTTKNAKDIQAAFQSVTVIYVRPLLGIQLYELYEQHLKTNSVLTPKQAELFGYIQYYMALRVEREMMLNVLKISNHGVTEHEKVASMENIKIMRQDAESRAEAVKKLLLDYLNAHKPDFPEFFPETLAVINDNGSHGDFTGGIVFDTAPKFFYQ